MTRKLCVVTGTRAEYGLLFWLMKAIEADESLELQIIATGMHLSPEFGLTYKEIEKDFRINKKIEMLLSSDTSIGISKSMGLAQISFAEAYDELKPDMVVLLGDRYEIFSAAAAAMVSQIPIAHIHGGESTEGLIDEPIRHAVTKMSHLHFTSTDEYRKRVIRLGEAPERVFHVGAMGLDNIKKMELLSRNDFEESIGFKLGKKNVLVTFHPVTLEHATAKEQFASLLNSLDKLNDTHIIFTKANSDTDGRIINQMIDRYVAERPEKSAAFTSLGQLRYLSALQFMDGVAGNSSSGLIEAPSFRIGTINIGDRQRGRIRAESVIDALPIESEIDAAFAKLYSGEFQELLKSVQNPYAAQVSAAAEGASEKVKAILKEYELTGILKKKFYEE